MVRAAQSRLHRLLAALDLPCKRRLCLALLSSQLLLVPGEREIQPTRSA